MERMHCSFRTCSSYFLEHDKKCTRLDTSTGRSRRGTNKHQDTQYKQAGIRKLPNRIGGKSGGSRRNALEERPQPCYISLSVSVPTTSKTKLVTITTLECRVSFLKHFCFPISRITRNPNPPKMISVHVVRFKRTSS